ncbi:MAG: hypothetical protein ACTSRZ_05855 [Promethearchaeota archaeon]
MDPNNFIIYDAHKAVNYSQIYPPISSRIIKDMAILEGYKKSYNAKEIKQFNQIKNYKTIQYLLNIPQFKVWVFETFRWLPSTLKFSEKNQSISINLELYISINVFFQFIKKAEYIDSSTHENLNNNNLLKIFCFSFINISLDNNTLKKNKSNLSYFFPLVIEVNFNKKIKSLSKNIDEIHRGKKVRKTIEPFFKFLLYNEDIASIVVYPAEYDIEFWESLLYLLISSRNEINLENKNFKLDLALKMEENNHTKKNMTPNNPLSNINIDKMKQLFEIQPLGDSNTTNVVIKFKSKKSSNLNFVCKVYKQAQHDLKFNRESFMLQELNKLNFQYIPKMYGNINVKYYSNLDTKNANRQITHDFDKNTNMESSKLFINIIFMEYINAAGDIGSIFWNELNDNYMEKLLKFHNVFNTNNNVIKKNQANSNSFLFCSENRTCCYFNKNMEDIYDTIFKTSSKYTKIIANATLQLHRHLKIITSKFPNLIKPTQEAVDNASVYKEFPVFWKIFNDIDMIYYSIRNRLKLKLYLKNLDKLIRNLIEEKFQSFIENESRIINELQLIHQDLHLQQMLVAQISDKDNNSNTMREPIFLDLEGDPQLIIEKRFEPQSIYIDLASLIRSFNYIKHFSLATLIENVKVATAQKKFNSISPIHKIFLTLSNLTNRISERLGFEYLKTLPLNFKYIALNAILKILYFFKNTTIDSGSKTIANTKLIAELVESSLLVINLIQSVIKKHSAEKVNNSLDEIISYLKALLNNKSNLHDYHNSNIINIDFIKFINLLGLEESDIEELNQVSIIIEALDAWELLCVKKILDSYFYPELIEKKLFVILFYALRRCLTEFQYELDYRIDNSIVPAIGFLELIFLLKNEIKKIK